MTSRSASDRLNVRAGLGLALALTSALIFFLVSGVVAFLNTRTLYDNAELVSHTQEVISVLDDVLSLARAGETGQRGFVITGDHAYLDPYNAAALAVDGRVRMLEELTVDNATQQSRIPALRTAVSRRFELLKEVVDLRRTQGFEAARAKVAQEEGRKTMEAIRDQVAKMKDDELSLLKARIVETSTAYRSAIGTGLLTGLVGIALVGIIGFLLRRAALIRRRQDWLQGGQLGLSAAIVGDLRLEQLGDKVLKFIAEYLDAHAGAFFAFEAGRFRRAATYGVPPAVRYRRVSKPATACSAKRRKTAARSWSRPCPTAISPSVRRWARVRRGTCWSLRSGPTASSTA